MNSKNIGFTKILVWGLFWRVSKSPFYYNSYNDLAGSMTTHFIGYNVNRLGIKFIKIIASLFIILDKLG